MIDPRSCRTLAFTFTFAFAASAGAVASAQQDGEVEYNAGLTHLREGRTEMAIDSFKSAVSKDKKDPYARHALGLAYQAKADFKKAIEAFEKALDLRPSLIIARNDLGTALILVGRRQDGLDQLLRAFNDPTNPAPEMSARNLGQAYFESGQYGRALNWYRTSLGRNTSYPDAYVGIAKCLKATGDLEGAILNLEAGVKQLPGEHRVKFELGRAYFEAGRFSEARAAYEAIVAEVPGSPFGRAASGLLQKFPQ